MNKSFYHLLLVTQLLMASLMSYGEVMTTYYHNDVVGSPIAATDENGDVLWREEYIPYGERNYQEQAASGNARWYTGHVHDQETELAYMGARYYDPVLGRFMGVDPVGFDEGNLHSFNRYAYANNNPYRFVDPDGNTPETIWDAGNVVIGVVSFTANMAAGNYVAAAVDAVGIGLDTAATLTPVVPGGAGSIIKAARGADKVVDVTKRIEISARRHPEAAQHIKDAQAAGQPSTLTIDRAGAAANRKESLQGVPTKKGLDRDEYPPAMFKEGGAGASVRHINRGDNRGAGSCIGNQCSAFPDGTRVLIDVVD